VTYRFEYADAWTHARVLIDRDRIAGTGLAGGGIGADLKIEDGALYRYAGGWQAVTPNPVVARTGSVDGQTVVEWTVDRAAIGAGYLIANGGLYRHAGAGWAWTRIASAHHEVDGAANDWWIARSDLGLTVGSPYVVAVFQAHGGGAPFYLGPPYPHAFTR
jgi:hypothetical protein